MCKLKTCWIALTPIYLTPVNSRILSSLQTTLTPNPDKCYKCYTEAKQTDTCVWMNSSIAFMFQCRWFGNCSHMKLCYESNSAHSIGQVHQHAIRVCVCVLHVCNMCVWVWTDIRWHDTTCEDSSHISVTWPRVQALTLHSQSRSCTENMLIILLGHSCRQPPILCVMSWSVVYYVYELYVCVCVYVMVVVIVT